MESSMKLHFLRLYLQMFYKPSDTFRVLSENRKKLPFGFYALLFPAVGYTLFYTMAHFAGGSPSTFKPWLALPIEDYFSYDIILTLPGYYLAWVGASATVYLILRMVNGKSTFDVILAVIGFGVGVATWSSMLHDLTDAFLSITGVISMKEYEKLLNEPTIWRTLLWTLYSVYFGWILTLFTIGLRVAEGFGRVKSILVAFIGLIVFQVILLIFIR